MRILILCHGEYSHANETKRRRNVKQQVPLLPPRHRRFPKSLLRLRHTQHTLFPADVRPARYNARGPFLILDPWRIWFLGDARDARRRGLHAPELYGARGRDAQRGLAGRVLRFHGGRFSDA